MPDKLIVLEDGTIASPEFVKAVGDARLARYAEVAMAIGRTTHEIVELVELGRQARREEAATKKQ